MTGNWYVCNKSFSYSGGAPSGAPYPYRKLKETHKLIFSMVIMASSIAHGRVHTMTAATATVESHKMAAIPPNNRLTDTCSLGLLCTSLILNINLCYDQLTPVKTRYLLTSSTGPYHGLKSATHRGHIFLLKLTGDQVLVFNWIAGSCQQGRIVLKLVNSSPGLKFIRITTFLFYTNVFSCFVSCIW